MSFTVVIPARYGSSRFPGKPLATIHGEPMVIRVAKQAQKSGAREVIIATDHEAIMEVAHQFGFQAQLTRGDHATGTDRLAEVVAKRRFSASHIVVNVQGDEPLIPPELIRQVADNLASHRLASIATACHPIHTAQPFFNPNVVKVVFDRAGYALYFSRAPIPWARDSFQRQTTRLPAGFIAYRHLGIYAYRCHFLNEFKKMKPSHAEQFEALEQLRALDYGHRISVQISLEAPHPGVDTLQDLYRVRRLFTSQKSD